MLDQVAAGVTCRCANNRHWIRQGGWQELLRLGELRLRPCCQFCTFADVIELLVDQQNFGIVSITQECFDLVACQLSVRAILPPDLTITLEDSVKDKNGLL